MSWGLREGDRVLLNIKPRSLGGAWTHVQYLEIHGWSKGTVLLGIARNKALYVRFGLEMGLLPLFVAAARKTVSSHVGTMKFTDQSAYRIILEVIDKQFRLDGSIRLR
jgi:hypothetical protein